MRANSILRTTYALSIAIAVVRFVTLALSPSSWRTSSMFDFASAATTYAASIALIIGCLELASRLRGRAALGGKLAALGYGLSLVLAFVNEAMRVALTTGSHGWFLLLPVEGIAVGLVITAGFVLAAWDRRREALVAAAVTLLPYALQFVFPYLVSDDIDTTMRRLDLTSSVAWIARIAALLWLANLAAISEPAPSWPRVARGIRWMARALWLRIAAIVAFAFFGMVAHDQLATLVQPMIEAVLLVGFALGALAVCRGAHVPIFVIAALAILWCAGVAIVKEPWLYELANGTTFGVFGGASLALAVPLAMIVAMATIALAIRGLPPLAAVAELTADHAIAFVVLELASLGVRHAGAAFVAVVLDAAACTVLAMWLGRAADLLAAEQPPLPTAKLL